LFFQVYPTNPVSKILQPLLPFGSIKCIVGEF
jgi:hypothetical protein